MCRLDSAIVFLIVQANYLLSLCQGPHREKETLPGYMTSKDGLPSIRAISVKFARFI